MWLMTTIGFFSIVEKPEDKKEGMPDNPDQGQAGPRKPSGQIFADPWTNQGTCGF